jgi:hypothetical protein
VKTNGYLIVKKMARLIRNLAIFYLERTKYNMIKTIIVTTILILLALAIIGVIRSENTQFTLLKASPEIDRKENIAFKFMLILIILFVLLLITSWF